MDPLATSRPARSPEFTRESTPGRLSGMEKLENRVSSEIGDDIRRNVHEWREQNSQQWLVTPETARLLRHWRKHNFSGVRPFFCQVEAVETVIWLTEVVPQLGKSGKRFTDYLAAANQDVENGLMRLALKLATGAGKTTVMAMLIIWQTVNAARHPQSPRFTRGFLVVAPGITIRDRLRVLQPNDPDSYYQGRELVPNDMLPSIERAKIVITNYHAFKLRERIELSKGGKALLQGRGQALNTLETEGQMMQRVMPDLMGMKNILVINDEAHHCYREKREEGKEISKLKGDEKKEAEKNQEAARLWISGIEAVNRKMGVSRVTDLSATPFFLSGSGYVEGTLFPWTMSDFSLMDAIECGIVKLPRVPVTDNLIQSNTMPMFRNLWEHIQPKMPKKGRNQSTGLDPLALPPQLLTALETLYGHYKTTYELWQQAGTQVPPCFIIVCNNTATSKLIYDYISGFQRKNADGTMSLEFGKIPLFQNHDEHGNPLERPVTLLIDSEQIESGDALNDNFRKVASDEIDRFRRERIERTGDRHWAENITDQDLLREVMNTVGRPGQLGDSIRCVVSVSMLSEGWDANTVTHVLGVRAFGTQLLCEQVVGRALRRQSYELNENNLFNVEYADVFGVPFDFAQPVVTPPPEPPPDTIKVHAVRPDRDALEIQFPRVAGYRVQLPEDHLTVEFNDDSLLVLNPDLVGATEVQDAGIIGESVELNLVHTEVRSSQVVYELTAHLLLTHWRDGHGLPQLHLFGQLKRIVRQWTEQYLECHGSTNPAQLKYKTLADMACQKIMGAINRSEIKKGRQIHAVIDSYNPVGSTADVNFNTSRASRYATDSRFCHVNWVIYDSQWEAEFCRIAESHPRVLAYVKNHGLGFEVPYRYGSEQRIYIPDFIVLIDDGRGKDDPLQLIVEIKGLRKEDAKNKKMTMEVYWVPGVNNCGSFGRWDFAEFTNVNTMKKEFNAKVEAEINKAVDMAATEKGLS